MRRPSPCASSFRLEELDVQLDDGSRLELLLKEVGPDGMFSEARRTRPAFLADSQRELRVYRALLSPALCGTPQCHGVLVEGSPDRQWLVLERVRGTELRHSGARATWEAAAAWIAAFHARFPEPAANAYAHDLRLLRYDAEFYRCWVSRALTFAEGDAQARAILGRIAAGFEAVIRRLTALPQTIIHGEYYPSNILAAETPDGLRICPVDWEMAALGPGLVDLAALSAGWDDDARQALLAAYLEQHHRAGRHEKDVLVDLDCCRLHLALRMLGWSPEWTPPPQHTFNWLAEAAGAAQRLQL